MPGSLSLLLQLSLVVISSSAPLPVNIGINEAGETESQQQSVKESQVDKASGGRQAKSLFFDYPIAAYRTNEYGDGGLEYDSMLVDQQDDIDSDDDLSRTLPSRKRYHGSNSGGSNSASFPNSPIYYIRLPATPYMFVPGLGYVSNPPTMNQLPSSPPDPFINLPLNFMSNGKPTNIYQWPEVRPDPFSRPPYHQQQQIQPPSFQQHGGYSHFDNGYRKKPPSYSRPSTNSLYQNVPSTPVKKPAKPTTDSKVTHLKGPFPFNGRPTDIIVLRDSYNALYSDALTNFYP